MKKTVLFILLLLVVALLTSCNPSAGDDVISNGAYLESLTSLQYGRSESGSIQAGHRTELNMDTQRFQSADAESTLSMEINGVTYDLDYSITERSPYYQDELYKYTANTEQGTVFAKIDVATGKCVDWTGVIRQLEEGQTALTHEQQYEIAYKFLQTHVDCPEEYRTVFQNGENLWFVYFARYVGDLETYERVEVVVDQTGNIMSYSLEHVGHMNGVGTVPTSIIEMAHEELEHRGHDIYGNLGEGYEYALETVIDCLVRLDDGRLALNGHVNADITDPDGNTISDGAWFIIPITEPTQ